MKFFDGMSRPTRATGMVLLVVAVVAAMIGGFTLVVGAGNTDNTAAPPTSDAAPPGQGSNDGSRPQTTPADSGTATSPADQPPSGSVEASSPPSSPSATQPPGAGDGADAGGQGQDKQAAQKTIAVRVYNNSTVRGLANRAGDDLRAKGWNVVETGNYSGGIIPTSTAYYRPGTDEEFAANALARQFGMRAEPRFDGIAHSRPGVIVIVTKDYSGAVKGK